MMGTHLLIDFETMGTNVNEAPVIDCSAIIFNTEKMLSNDPYTMRSLSSVKRFKLSMKDQVANYGWKIEEETLKFWETVSDDAKAKIKMSSTDLTVNQFCEQFIDYLIDNPKIDRWWSRSNTFDPIIIWRIFKAAQKASHLEAHLSYWKVRDIRTFIDAKLNFPAATSFTPVEDEEFWNKAFVQHDSSWDVLADMLRIQKIMRAEKRFGIDKKMIGTFRGKAIDETMSKQELLDIILYLSKDLERQREYQKDYEKLITKNYR